MGAPSLADHIAITNLTIAYTWAIDSHRWDDLDAVFLPDATADLASPATLQGVGAIKARIANALEPLDDSQHIVSNHQIDVDGDEGTCRCYLQAQHVRRTADGGPNFIIGGRYEDRVVRTADGWRIAHRTLVSMWREGNPAVIHPAQPMSAPLVPPST